MIILKKIFKKPIALVFMLILCNIDSYYAPGAAAASSGQEELEEGSYFTKVADLSDYSALSLDGGGARGAFSAEVLRQIEVRSKQSVAKFFRGGLTGTSTGGLIALALSVPRDEDLHRFRTGDKKGNLDWLHNHARPKHTAEQVGELYNEADLLFAGGCECGPRCAENSKDCCDGVGQFLWSIFTCCGCFGCNKNCQGLCGPQYSNAHLRKRLKEMLGDTILGESIVPVQVVAYDIEHHEPIYFRSWEDRTKGIRMVDAAMASSAAPTYFPAISFEHDGISYKCVDGGLVDNNPSLAALVQLRKHLIVRGKRIDQTGSGFIIVSIGTGEKLASSGFEKLKRGGLLSWAGPAVSASMDGTSKVSAKLVKELLESEHGTKQIYYRIQTPLTAEHSAMDDPKVVSYLKGKVGGILESIDTVVERSQISFSEEVKSDLADMAIRLTSKGSSSDAESSGGAAAAAGGGK